MSTYNSNSSGRRSGRGPRRNRDHDQDDRPSQRHSSAPTSSPAPEKKGILQKIIGFFTGAKAAPAQKERPKYTPRSADKNNEAPRGGQRERSPRPEGGRGDSPRADRFTEGESRPEPTERPARVARKPEAIEVTTPKIYVGNLSFDASESDLSELFNGVGAVVSAEIVTHKQTEKSKGFGFVTLSSVDEAKRAVEVLHDKDFMGRKLVVSGAKTPMERE